MWPVALSGRLPVVALVSHYLTNKLIGRESIPDRKTFHTMTMRSGVISGISSGFPGLFQSLGQVTHVLLTRSPLIRTVQAPFVTVRLACVKHAASVRPEPGSNSPLMFAIRPPEEDRKLLNHQKVSFNNPAEHKQPAKNHCLSVSTKGKTRPPHPPNPTTGPDRRDATR